MRTHFKKLSKYIRVTDMQIVDARLNLIRNSLRQVFEIASLDFTYGQKHYIGDNKIQSCALFQIKIDFAADDADHPRSKLAYSPQFKEIKEAIEKSIEQGISKVKDY